MFLLLGFLFREEPLSIKTASYESRISGLEKQKNTILDSVDGMKNEYTVRCKNLRVKKLDEDVKKLLQEVYEIDLKIFSLKRKIEEINRETNRACIK